MDQNISFEGGGLKVSEQVISKVVTTIFPGQNYLDTLILIFVWFLVGLVTLGVFFYFSKKHKMFKTMTPLEKTIFSIFFGFLSFMIVVITYMPIYLLNYDPLNFRNGSMLPFMIVAGFLLYGCLAFASASVDGRPFLLRTFRNLETFLILFSMTLISVILSFKTKNYFLLSWIVVDVLYIKYRLMNTA